MTDRHDDASPGVPTTVTAVAGEEPGGGHQTPLPRMPKARENSMAIDQVDRTVVTQEPAPAGQEVVHTTSRRITRTGPGGAEMARRVAVLVFGLIQIVIGARILLLLLDAREANALVSAVLTISQVFVAPFEGMLRTNSLNASGSALDVTAIVAFVGWTLLELIVLWIIGIFGRRSVTEVI
jgi:hypothetical protein